MIRRIFSVCVVLFGCFVSSCARETHIVAINDFEHDSGANAAPLLAQLSATQAQLTNVRARFRVTAKETLGKKSFTQSVVFSRPDRLRVDTFATAMNKLVGLLVAADGELRVFDLEHSVVYLGQATAKNLETTTGLPFTVAEVALWFCGQWLVPAEQEIEFSRIRQSADGKRYLLEVRSFAGREYWLELERGETNQRLRLTTLELWTKRGNDLVFTTRFRYQHEVETNNLELSLPTSFSAEFPEKKLSVEFENESFSLNVPQAAIGEQLFKVEVPPEMAVRYLGRQ